MQQPGASNQQGDDSQHIADLQAADAWVSVHPQPAAVEYRHELIQISCARVLLALGQPLAALERLVPLVQPAEAGGRGGRLIEIDLLGALAHAALNEQSAAQTALLSALARAEPEGYLRLFVDEGEPARLLLTRFVQHSGQGSLLSYAQHLLAAFPQARLAGAAGDILIPATDVLVEHLTARELEVLERICAGDSNQEIAKRLVITVSAVKKHTGNIFGKLAVTSRTQAIVRARQLGLISDP